MKKMLISTAMAAYMVAALASQNGVVNYIPFKLNLGAKGQARIEYSVNNPSLGLLQDIECTGDPSVTITYKTPEGATATTHVPVIFKSVHAIKSGGVAIKERGFFDLSISADQNRTHHIIACRYIHISK